VASCWQLSPTGDSSADKLDLTGDGDYTDTGERNATNTFDLANKYVNRNGKSETTGLYYLGNQQKFAIQDGTSFISNEHGYVYDAFGRMVEYRSKVSDSITALARYRYNGLGHRIGWQYDADASSTLTTSEQFYSVFDNRWRIVATLRAGDTNPKEAFAYHAAGFAGSGNSSYIDSVIMRDRDANTAWTAASDGTLEERVYYVQNWRSDVVALVNAAGAPLEEIRYTAYGTPSSHPIADVNGDGVVGTADVTAWDDLFASTGTLAVYEHNNLDRDELFPGDAGDDGFFYDQYGKTPKQAYGVNALSYLGNRKGYAGYEWDETARTWHVRHRVLDSASGKWTRMDPLGYVDGAGVMEYVASAPRRYVDTYGLARATGDCSALAAEYCTRGGGVAANLICVSMCTEAILAACGTASDAELIQIGWNKRNACLRMFDYNNMDVIEDPPTALELLKRCLDETCGAPCKDCLFELAETAVPLLAVFKRLKKFKRLLETEAACWSCAYSHWRGEPDIMSCLECATKRIRRQDNPDDLDWWDPAAMEKWTHQEWHRWAWDMQITFIDDIFGGVSCFNCITCIHNKC
jgi:RHS repeat-associated protein